MLRPVTADVIDPRLMAASAVVEICPTEMTGTNTRLYSMTEALISKCQYSRYSVNGVLTQRWGVYNEGLFAFPPKTWSFGWHLPDRNRRWLRLDGCGSGGAEWTL